MSTSKNMSHSGAGATGVGTVAPQKKPMSATKRGAITGARIVAAPMALIATTLAGSVKTKVLAAVLFKTGVGRGWRSD